MKRSLFLIFFLLLALGATLYLIYQTTSTSSKAAGSSGSTTDYVNNSYLFASPLQAKANSQEQIRVTVFILDSRGLGVPNLLVNLNKPSGLTTVTAQDTTDNMGRATFDLTSASPGKFPVTAQINGKPLPQTVSLSFN